MSDTQAGSSRKPFRSYHRDLDDDMSPEERKRQRRRRQLTRKTPEQRRKIIQYMRRHNEKDGRLFYCDYCDLFVSSSQRCWRRHLTSGKHMDNVEGYWRMASHVEANWLNEINESVAKAHLYALHAKQHAAAGIGAATPLPAVRVGPGIVVGGAPPPQQQPADGVLGARPVAPLVAIRVGVGIVPPVVRVAGKVVPAPPQVQQPPTLQGPDAASSDPLNEEANNEEASLSP